jgi:hypothetical protein
MHKCMVVQNLVDLNTSLFEFYIKAVLQVHLAEPPMLVVAFFREDLPDVAPFYIYSQQSTKVHGSGTSFQSLNANFSGFRKTCNLFR